MHDEERKILHCISSFRAGGAERQLAYLARATAEMGIPTHIAYVHKGPNLGIVDKSQVVLHQIRAVGNHDPRIAYRLIRLIRTVRPRLIHTWLTQMDVIGGLSALATGTPFVLSERASALAYPGSWKDRLRARIGRRAAAVMANSEAGRSYWKGLGYRGTIHVIRNGVPLKEIARTPPAELGVWGVPKGCRVILFAGRYSQQKNVVLMLDALVQVVRERADVTALLFGEGPLRGELEQRLSASGFGGRIRVEPFNDSLWSVMKAADLFVSVSRFEGNPNTVLEAIATECPVVVSNIPEHREFLDESSAYFAIPSSVDDVATVIGHALDNRAETRGKSDIAYRAIGGWSMEARAREYVDLYREILDGTLALGLRRYG